MINTDKVDHTLKTKLVHS